MLHDSRPVKEQAVEDIAIHGGELESMVVAEYVDAQNMPSTRCFQWARKESRYEAGRLIGWAIKNNRMIRVIPFNVYTQTL